MRTVVGVLCLLLAARPAEPCAVAPPDLRARIEIADEEALIVWDAATHTEHFIRRASFHSSAPSFGFLVPTPTAPKLTEVDDALFGTLAEATAPKVEYRTERPVELGSWFVDGCMLDRGSMKATGAARDSVRVIATTNVAGFDATTVEADDPHALARWLGDHGFVSTEQLEQWLARYVADRWVITAFVVAGAESATAPDVATRAIDMTFTTERPFYPYREPATTLAPTGPRSLLVYTASSSRLAGMLAGSPWSATVPFAHAITPSSIGAVLGTQGYLTVFRDDSSPRRGIDEVYFAPAVGDVTPPPFVVTSKEPITIPLDALLILGFGTFWFVRRRRRKR